MSRLITVENKIELNREIQNYMLKGYSVKTQTENGASLVNND